MNTQLKTIITSAAAGALMLTAMSGIAAPQTTTPALKLEPAQTQMQKLQKPHHHARKRGMEMICFKKARGPWNLGLKRSLDLSTADAQTITKAALLMRGHKDLSVGKIESFVGKRGGKMYRIQIVGQNNKVIKNIVLNSRNGHIRPLRLHKATQQ